MKSMWPSPTTSCTNISTTPPQFSGTTDTIEHVYCCTGSMQLHATSFQQLELQTGKRRYFASNQIS